MRKQPLGRAGASGPAPAEQEESVGFSGTLGHEAAEEGVNLKMGGHGTPCPSFAQAIFFVPRPPGLSSQACSLMPPALTLFCLRPAPPPPGAGSGDGL